MVMVGEDAEGSRGVVQWWLPRIAKILKAEGWREVGWNEERERKEGRKERREGRRGEGREGVIM